MSRQMSNPGGELVRSEAPSELLRELVAHLRENRTQLREEWVVRITETRLLTAMTKEEIFAEATSVYDSYVEALETEAFEALQATRATCRNGSFREGWRRTKWWASCCCCATFWRGRCSPSTRRTSRN